MKVLMFGWEFPPHISGGLGTASYGLTRGLSTIPELDILFVVPKAYGDEDQSRMRLIGAGDVSLDTRHLKFSKLLRQISSLEAGSTSQYCTTIAYMGLKPASVVIVMISECPSRSASPDSTVFRNRPDLRLLAGLAGRFLPNDLYALAPCLIRCLKRRRLGSGCRWG